MPTVEDQAKQNMSTHGRIANAAIGLLKGLATGGVGGAIEGAINPKIAQERYAANEQKTQMAPDIERMNLANTIADATNRHAQTKYWEDSTHNQEIQNNREYVQNAQLYGAKILDVPASDSQQHLLESVQRLFGIGKNVLPLEVSKGQYVALDLGSVASSPLGYEDYLHGALMRGYTPQDPQSFMASNRINKGAAAQSVKEGHDYRGGSIEKATNPNASLALLTEYQGRLKNITDGTNNIINDPKFNDEKPKVVKEVQDNIAKLAQIHAGQVTEALKLKEAYNQSRVYKVDNLPDGTTRYMTGAQVVQAFGLHPENIGNVTPTNNVAPTGPSGTTAPNSSGAPFLPMSGHSNRMLQATDPNTGKQVAGTQSTFYKYGIDPQSATVADSKIAFSVQTARRLLSQGDLLTRIHQEVEGLKADQTLGGARINDFLATKLGTGDKFKPLQNDLKLFSTTLQQIHVGNKGSDQMYNEFKGMWDAGKMDYKTLNAVLHEGFNYVDDRAMWVDRKNHL